MKKIGFVFAICCVLSGAGCQPRPADLVLDSFEGEIDKATVDFGAAQGSSLTVTASKNFKVDGEQSMKVEYDLKPSGYMWVARGYNLDVEGAAKWNIMPENVKWQEYDTMSLYVYGNGTEGVIAFDIRDAGGEFWRALIDDDFKGWKEISFLFSDFFVRKDWQPQKAEVNDVLDFPIKSFQFEPRMPGKGEYHFDCVKVSKSKR